MQMTKEKMKDSGIEWIGKIPQDWSVEKLKYVSKLRNEKLEQTDGLDYIGLENIESGTGKVVASKEIMEPESVINHFHAGDVLFGKLRPYLAKVLPVMKEGVCTSELLVLQPKVVTQDFLSYRLIASDFISLVDNSTYGAKMPRASWDFIGNIPIAHPSKDKQKKIGEFLAVKTSTIDHAIEQKRKLIDLLKEKRTAIINRAVTRGLDEDVKLVDSGVEWIGKVPKGWKMRKIAQSFNLIGSGSTPASGNEAFYEDGEINWIITGDLNDGTIYEASKKITKEAFASSSALKMYPRGTLLIAMYGATIGRVALIDIPACTNQACCALGDSPYFENKFVYYWFLINRKNIVDIYSYGSGQPNISQDTIKRLHIPAPSRDEQKKVVAFLDNKMDAIDQLISKVENSIELLTEYRTSLISHVVGGG